MRDNLPCKSDMRPPKEKLNVKLLRRIQKAILRHPDQFDMEWWFQSYLKFNSKPALLEAGGCGTAACIAGWAVHLSRGHRRLATTRRAVWDTHNEATRLLRIDSGRQCPLYNIGAWPEEFRNGYEGAETPLARAKVAVARIDHFIETGL